MTLGSDTKILSIGLHPSQLDYGKHPGLDEAELIARVEAGTAMLRDSGFDVVSCSVPVDPDAAEELINDRLAEADYGLAMIGGGVRMLPEQTLLFERIVNVLTAASPGIRLCFNTSPETTVDALLRWVQPRGRG
ncbi:hypothetical protein [Nocardia amikacinitolerans]|uniref:hypothetical protein n=1 Tax=Nocardia amikacinitolerans TaxID=756689 RepID=UPI0020A2C5A7|nr:hypothetical protein [Nocardia amikacinitolerans]MCP2289537.1 hypothetical protein [Nocardia amikacinitolerans]